MGEPLTPQPSNSDTGDAKTRLEEAYEKWNIALLVAQVSALVHASAASELAEIDARLAVHLQHRHMVIEESGVTQLRGTFRLSRWVLAIAAVLTAVGAMLYAFGLPTEESAPDTTINAMRFIPGVPSPDEGDAVVVQIVGLVDDRLSECGQTDLDAVLVGGAGSVTQVVVGESAPEACQGQWLLPAGSWYAVSGRPLRAEVTTTTPEEESSTTVPQTTTTTP